jgi:hypothetical protein
MFAKPDESHADTNDKYPQQALPADPLVQEQRGAQGPDCVTQSRHRYDESYIFKGQHGQQGEKRQRHQPSSNPHPARASRPEDELKNRRRPEVVNFSDGFHCSRGTQLTPRPGNNEDEQKQIFAHGYLFSVVRCWVWPTTKTPAQMMMMPAHRNGFTVSPKMK